MIGIMCLFSAGYATFSSNFLVSGKGTIIEAPITIDELREKKCNAIKDDGLYVDTYEGERCIYRGTNPDNYISFNDELWRIIAVENDNTLKIIRNGTIGKIAWDKSNSNVWTRPATLNTYLNNNYYKTIAEDYKNIINKHDFPIGSVIWSNDNLAEQITSEKGVLWNGNIALMSASDYIRANTNTSECGNFKLQYGNADCQATNYIYGITKLEGDNNAGWTLNLRDTTLNSYYVVLITGCATTGNQVNMTNVDVIPTLYLNSDIKLSGKGTENNPYKIVFNNM